MSHRFLTDFKMMSHGLVTRHVGIYGIVQVDAGYMFVCFGPGRASGLSMSGRSGLGPGLKTSGREFRPVATSRAFIFCTVCILVLVCKTRFLHAKPRGAAASTAPPLATPCCVPLVNYTAM